MINSPLTRDYLFTLWEAHTDAENATDNRALPAEPHWVTVPGISPDDVAWRSGWTSNPFEVIEGQHDWDNDSIDLLVRRTDVPGGCEQRIRLRVTPQQQPAHV